ncbi:hypothetical protein [Burkholderia singularis]|nr:hypothetical protein [Burkholderia singularis]
MVNPSVNELTPSFSFHAASAANAEPHAHLNLKSRKPSTGVAAPAPASSGLRDGLPPRSATSGWSSQLRRAAPIMLDALASTTHAINAVKNHSTGSGLPAGVNLISSDLPWAAGSAINLGQRLAQTPSQAPRRTTEKLANYSAHASDGLATLAAAASAASTLRPDTANDTSRLSGGLWTLSAIAKGIHALFDKNRTWLSRGCQLVSAACDGFAGLNLIAAQSASGRGDTAASADHMLKTAAGWSASTFAAAMGHALQNGPSVYPSAETRVRPL